MTALLGGHVDVSVSTLGVIVPDVNIELGSRQQQALEALAPDLDFDAVRSHLDELARVVAGDPDGGPMARLDAPERFRWVTSPSSTMLQPSEVHGGITESPEASLQDLFERLVR